MARIARVDERYLYAAVRYVERNPVRAGLVQRAEDYRWSSARAHVFKEHNFLLSDYFMTSEIKDRSEYLSGEDVEQENDLFQKHASTGRPLGTERVIIKLEELTGRVLRRGNPGPKKRR